MMNCLIVCLTASVRNIMWDQGLILHSMVSNCSFRRFATHATFLSCPGINAFNNIVFNISSFSQVLTFPWFPKLLLPILQFLSRFSFTSKGRFLLNTRIYLHLNNSKRMCKYRRSSCYWMYALAVACFRTGHGLCNFAFGKADFVFWSSRRGPTNEETTKTGWSYGQVMTWTQEISFGFRGEKGWTWSLHA